MMPQRVDLIERELESHWSDLRFAPESKTAEILRSCLFAGGEVEGKAALEGIAKRGVHNRQRRVVARELMAAHLGVDPKRIREADKTQH